MQHQVIELDCAPTVMFPDRILSLVVAGTSLADSEPTHAELRKAPSGCLTWDFNNTSKSDWQKALPTIIKRIESLQMSGAIHYGSWYPAELYKATM